MKEKEKFDGTKVYKLGSCKYYQPIIYLLNTVHYLFTFKGGRKELLDLEKGVVTLTRERLVDETIKSTEKLKKGSAKELSRVKKTLSKYKTMPDKKVIELVDSSKIPWDRIERDFVKTRKARDCMIQWTNYLYPKHIAPKWTKEEDKQLLSLVTEAKGRDWVRIAEELNSEVCAYFIHLPFRLFNSQHFIIAKETSTPMHFAVPAMPERKPHKEKVE